MYYINTGEYCKLKTDSYRQVISKFHIQVQNLSICRLARFVNNKNFHPHVYRSFHILQ